MAGMLLQAGIIDPGNGRMVFQEPGHLQGILRVPLLPQSQRLHALQEEEGIEGAQSRPKVTKKLHSYLEDESHISETREVAEGIPVLQAVIAGIRLRELRKLSVRPVELA